MHMRSSPVLTTYYIIYFLVIFSVMGCIMFVFIILLFLNLTSFPPGSRKVPSMSNGTSGKESVSSLLASLMEVVRTTVACECVYVRAMVIKALIWMQSPHESFDELKSIIASELSDPAWPATLLNDVLLTLHARFKVL